MVTMTCLCGLTTKTFQKLTEKDFSPEGWENDCCRKLLKETPEPFETPAEAVEFTTPLQFEKAPPEEASPEEASPEEAAPEETPAEAVVEAEAPRAKRRGRKAKKAE